MTLSTPTQQRYLTSTIVSSARALLGTNARASSLQHKWQNVLLRRSARISSSTTTPIKQTRQTHLSKLTNPTSSPTYPLTFNTHLPHTKTSNSSPSFQSYNPNPKPRHPRHSQNPHCRNRNPHNTMSLRQRTQGSNGEMAS